MHTKASIGFGMPVSISLLYRDKNRYIWNILSIQLVRLSKQRTGLPWSSVDVDSLQLYASFRQALIQWAGLQFSVREPKIKSNHSISAKPPDNTTSNRKPSRSPFHRGDCHSKMEREETRILVFLSQDLSLEQRRALVWGSRITCFQDSLKHLNRSLAAYHSERAPFLWVFFQCENRHTCRW